MIQSGMDWTCLGSADVVIATPMAREIACSLASPPSIDASLYRPVI